ncbi:M81 family metallopeptidase [Parapedobacter pyrenivorans]|uniref:M81 family metallopeptidase n=1 Tax=Parapedobacter pyrenivorans TaxID=1305674 RepID=UPI0033414B32
MGFRVALVGIYHESNTFIDTLTYAADFRNSHWLWGADIRNEYRDAHHEIGGMLEVMDREGVEVIPVVFAEATPGGVVHHEAYRALLDGILEGLQRAMPIDGCLVVPHGAGVSEQERDMDGHWLEAVRRMVGPEVPVVGTLDLHANVSERMVDVTDGLVVYKRNPHLDQRERGKEAAELMIRCLRERTKLFQKLVQLPLAISIEQQGTDVQPCKGIYEYARQLEKENGVSSVSVALGFPYADVPEMGSSIIVVTEGDAALADRIAQQLEAYILERKSGFVGDKIGVAEAVAKLPHLPKPVLLLDMGDNIGGGTPGNGLALVKALETRGLRYFSYQHDAAAVRDAAAVPVGASFDLCLSGFDEEGRKPWKQRVTLKDRVAGKFTEQTPRHGGQVRFDMGETLIIGTEGGGTLMVSTLRIPPFSLRQLTAFGLDPEAFDVLVAKGVNAPLAAYGPVCRSVLQVDTPGPSRADMGKLPYRFRRKPLFPFESI